MLCQSKHTIPLCSYTTPLPSVLILFLNSSPPYFSSQLPDSPTYMSLSRTATQKPSCLNQLLLLPLLPLSYNHLLFNATLLLFPFTGVGVCR